MPKPTLISGIQPSGKLHIGNYLGALRNFVVLQNSGKFECFFFVPDHHALTEPATRHEQAQRITNLTLDYIAAGLSAKKSTLFIQSHVPAHAELAWILSTVISIGELERMTQYKDKAQKGISPNAGLLNYPTLMAADILLYKAKVVPVGGDQSQHLEIARTFARNFNKKFGATFPEPKAVHTQVPRVASLSDPTKKMSKSDPKSCLFLTDPPSTIKEKIKSAVTDSHKTIGYDPEKRPGISNLISIYAEFSGLSEKEVVKKFKSASYAEFKTELANLIIENLKPFQTKRRELTKEKDIIAKTFADGSRKARKVAQTTIDEVKKKIGLI